MPVANDADQVERQIGAACAVGYTLPTIATDIYGQERQRVPHSVVIYTRPG